MRVAFCIYDWVEAKLPLQPWLSIRMVAERLAGSGHGIHVLTDAREPAGMDNLEVHRVDSLRGSNAARIGPVLDRLRPDALVMLPTPLNLVTSGWLDALPGCRRVGFASYPFYNRQELIRAAWHLPWRDVSQYLRHLPVPVRAWRSALCNRFEAIIAQSETTAARLAEVTGGKLPCHCIQPGIELQSWPLRQDHESAGDGRVRLLYLGAATAIRGFDVALESMTLIGDLPVQLRVLARGADGAALERIRATVAGRGLSGRVEVEGGWMDRDRLVREIRCADAVLQPFVLVPSELPVTAMEVIACGTPVIGTALDGLPSTIGPAGTVVAQGSARALAGAIGKFARSQSLRLEWYAGCRQQREAMLGWDAVSARWEAVLHG